MLMGERLAVVRDRIYELAVHYRVIDTAVEHYGVGPRKRSSRVAETFYLHGQVGMKLWENGFGSPLMMAPSTLKKWITDDGRAEKDDIRIALEKLLGINLHEDHNVVDGVGLGTMLAQYHLWQAGKFAPSNYQLEKMQNWKRML